MGECNPGIQQCIGRFDPRPESQGGVGKNVGALSVNRDV